MAAMHQIKFKWPRVCVMEQAVLETTKVPVEKLPILHSMINQCKEPIIDVFFSSVVTKLAQCAVAGV
eukprot:scaffold72985_cov52-Attheya_sp.AAC.2